MFEWWRHGKYLECGDMSPLSMCGRVRALQSVTPNMNARARYMVVAIAICSWFAISNHCAFAALATKTDSVQTECPFHSKPAKQKQEPSQVQCCKILRAVFLAKTKSWAPDNSKFSNAPFRVEVFAHLALAHNERALLSLDTGPPGARSFAELILQRSLLAHAPPFHA
ncbi:MAG: hypothetical protein DME90_11635 [Verrucomicrobia bacterium]|nr:MAG: hypothetical protein DME90_11635 [Verrucomicrobiota bacterium]